MIACRLMSYQGQKLNPAPSAAVEIEPWRTLQEALNALGEEGVLKAAWDSHVIDIQNAGRRVLAETVTLAIEQGKVKTLPDGSLELPPEVIAEAQAKAAEGMAAYAKGERRTRAARPSRLASKLASLDKAQLAEALRAAEAGDIARLVALLS